MGLALRFKKSVLLGHTTGKFSVRRLTPAVPFGLGVSTAVLLLVALHQLTAQTCQPGELRVFVKDSQQAAIFDAQVRIGLGAREIGTPTTETGGIAEFKNIPCGSWTVRASQAGFEDRYGTVSNASGSNALLSLVLEPTILH